MNLSRKAANLNGSAPANDESGVVFPTQAAWVHVRPQTDIVPQHISDPLFCTDIIDFNSLNESRLLVFAQSMQFLLPSLPAHSPHCLPRQWGSLSTGYWWWSPRLHGEQTSSSGSTSFFHTEAALGKKTGKYLTLHSLHFKWMATQGCSRAVRPTEGSRWTAHCTAASQELRLQKGETALKI